VEIDQPIVPHRMEVALTTQDAIDLLSSLSSGPKLAVALLAILIVVAALSRQVFSFLGSALLAVIAFSICEFPGSLPTILIIGFAAGSVLVSIAGIHQRRQLANLRRELARLSHTQTRLETAESRRMLADIRSTYSAHSRSAATDNVEAAENVRNTADVDTQTSALSVVDLKQSA
jgi:uncharacterized membrane protein YciS (DUF1049 family)